MEACPTGILIDINEEKKPEPVVEFVIELPPLEFLDPASPEPEKRVKTAVFDLEELLKDGHADLIESEEFNFDLALSPCSEEQNNEDPEEEVFFGPVQGFTEICAAASATAKHKDQAKVLPLSPLNPQQLAELFTEAHKLAYHIEYTRTDLPETPVDDLLRSLRQTTNTQTIPSHSETKFSPPVKSPSGDSGFADTSVTSACSQEADCNKTDDPLKLSLDFHSPDNHSLLQNSQISKLPVGATKKAEKAAMGKCGLQGLKVSKLSKNGARIPCTANSTSKPSSGLQRTGSKLLKMGAGTHSGLKLPQTRSRTFSNTSTCSNASSSSQVSSCSQTSSSNNTRRDASLLSLRAPKSKLQLKPCSTSMKIPTNKKPNAVSERKTGPMKARPFSPLKKGSGKEKENNLPKSMKPPESRAAPRRSASNSSTGSVSSLGSVGSLGSLGSMCSSTGSTPTPHKPEKNLQPKRLLTSGGPVTPLKDMSGVSRPRTPRSALTSSAIKRRSMLPTASSASRLKQPSSLTTRMTSKSESDGSPVFGIQKGIIGRGTSLRAPDISKKLFR